MVITLRTSVALSRVIPRESFEEANVTSIQLAFLLKLIIYIGFFFILSLKLNYTATVAGAGKQDPSLRKTLQKVQWF